MRHTISVLAYLSFILNVVFFGWWFHVATRYGSHEESVDKFEAVLPLSPSFTTLLLFLLTIFSLIVLSRRPSVFSKVLAYLQILFVFMHIWGYL